MGPKVGLVFFAASACLMVATAPTAHGMPSPNQDGCDLAKCQEIYRPVCGSDGKTYPNDCMLKNARCLSKSDLEVAQRGECPAPSAVVAEEGMPHTAEDSVNECPTVCTLEYEPVCGTNKETYGNRCQLLVAGCVRNAAIEIAYEGEC